MIDKQLQSLEGRPHIQSVVGRYGRTYYFRHDEYVGKSVFQYGEFSPEEVSHILSLAQERPGLVLDIGANIGCITQALFRHGFQVAAFEPQPAVYELLTMNCPEAILENCGLGSRDDRMVMPNVDYTKRGNFGGMGFGQVSMGIVVPVRTVDSFNFENVTLMKIDVEGFEEEVLRGAVDTIRRCKPTIYLEADRKEKLPSLAKFLDEIGYDHVPHNPPLFSKDNFYGNTKLCWDRPFVSMNWECRPKC